MTPSEVLGRAADLIRDTAAAADEGPWIVYRDGWCILSQPDREDRATWRTVCSEGFTPENGRWIALLSPAVSPMIESWLRETASYFDEFGEYWVTVPEQARNALDFAKTVLKG